MPIRNIPKNYRNVTGIGAQAKAVGKAMFESTLERDFLSLLDFNRAVTNFEVQPVTVQWLDAHDTTRSYTPDVLAYYRSPKRPTTLFEVKYRSDIRENWHELKPKFKAAIRFAKERGWRFKLISEVEIRTPRLENVKFLLPYKNRRPPVQCHMDMLDKALKRVKRSTPEKLLTEVFRDEWNRAQLLPTLWYLIAIGIICCNLDEKLTMNSAIWAQNT